MSQLEMFSPVDPGYTVIFLPPFFARTFTCPGCDREVDFDRDPWDALPYFQSELGWEFRSEKGWHCVCVRCFAAHDRRAQ